MGKWDGERGAVGGRGGVGGFNRGRQVSWRSCEEAGGACVVANGGRGGVRGSEKWRSGVG